MADVKFDEQAVAALVRSAEVVEHLRDIATDVARDADADKPSWLEEPVFAVAGVNRAGEAYAQVIARESGAVLAEFDQQPFLRPALDRRRGR